MNSGRYQTAGEVIRAGSRRSKEDQKARRVGTSLTLNELEARLVEAIEAVESGQGVDGRAAHRRLRKRIKERRG